MTHQLLFQILTTFLTLFNLPIMQYRFLLTVWIPGCISVLFIMSLGCLLLKRIPVAFFGAILIFRQIKFSRLEILSKHDKTLRVEPTQKALQDDAMCPFHISGVFFAAGSSLRTSTTTRTTAEMNAFRKKKKRVTSACIAFLWMKEKSR